MYNLYIYFFCIRKVNCLYATNVHVLPTCHQWLPKSLRINACVLTKTYFLTVWFFTVSLLPL